MKSAQLTGIRSIGISDVPAPTLQREDDVLLRVRMVGVCGSDMHYFRTGRIGSQVVQFPFTVGHECAGEVAAVGAGVTRLKVGDRVAVDPLISCGTCDQCLAHREHTCRNQRFLGCPGQASGALAEYLVMPERCCLPIPDSMTYEHAVLAEPYAIGLYAERLFESSGTGSVASGQTPPVAILGAGPIGLCVLAALKLAGYERVYVTEILENRCELAGDMGASWVGSPRSTDVVGEILRREPLGLAGVLECAGHQETVDQACELLSPGGVLMLVGIPEQDRLSVPIDLLRRKEIRLQNVRRQNQCACDAIGQIAARRVNLDSLATHSFDLESTQQAFDTVADYRDGVVKAMIAL